MSYRIGSFNMFKFQAYRSDDNIKKDIAKIAEIIRTEKFDIVALQEIFSETAMRILLKYLGPSWDGRWEQPYYASSSAAEGYAFIWNKMRFKLAATSLDDGNIRVAEPHVFYQYKLDRTKWQEKLIRDPYYGRFTPLALPKCEFRLINAHIMFSRNSQHSEDNPLGDVRMRRNEHSILAEALYPKIADKVYGNNCVGYTILLGDYNLNHPESSAYGAWLQEEFIIQDGRAIKRIKTVQTDLTTLRTPSEDPEEVDDGQIWANNYDHFSYDANRFEGKGIGMKSSRVNSVVYCSDYKEHRKIISDHVPIKLDVELRGNK